MSDSDLDARLAWQRHIGRDTTAMDWCEGVLNRYREAHRHYHDVRHVRWVVRHVDELAVDRALTDTAAVVAAAFFHDAIYDPRRHDNEAASARLSTMALTEIGWSTERADTVTQMIEGTARHSVEGASLDESVMFAADLAVLAADPGGYSDYVRNVRREYEHVGDSEWVVGRGAVLRSFLARPAIYAPVLELDSWEQRARGNLTAELEALDGSISRDG